MNAGNRTNNFQGQPINSNADLLSGSGLSSNVRTAGSNYNSNIVFGNSLSPAPLTGGFVFPGSPTGSSFAASAEKSRNTMESAMYSAGVKQGSVESPLATASKAARFGSSAIQTGLTAAGLGPAALAMHVSQQLGAAITSGLTTSGQNSIKADSAQNQRAWTIGGPQAANNLRMSQESRLASASNASSIGSTVAGPLGALIGWGLGTQGKADDFKVSSFSGDVNASDSGIARSVNSDAASGQSTLVDTL